MIRKLVRSLIGPLVRWASRGMDVMVYFSRCPEHGISQHWGLGPWGRMTISLTPAECRKWASQLYAMARDQQEGVPVHDEPDDDASDLRW